MRLSHRHRSHRRTLRRQPRRARRARDHRNGSGGGLVPKRPLAVGFFTDEEGARFAPDMLGSLVYVGGMPLEEALDIEGIDGAIVGDELERIGYAGVAPLPGAVPLCVRRAARRAGSGARGRGTRCGAVESVQGISWTEVEVTGQSNHAGTTPMHLRRDPGFVAAACTQFARELALELGHPRSPRSGGSSSTQPRQRGSRIGHVHASTSATPMSSAAEMPSSASPTSLTHGRGRRLLGRDPHPGSIRTGDLRPRGRRSRRVDRRRLGHSVKRCRRAPATMPR